MPTLSLKVSEETAAYLAAESKRLHVSKSRIMREAIEKRMRRGSGRPKPSLYDLMKDGLGCFNSGVSDLATNKKYMEGYGKWKRPKL